MMAKFCEHVRERGLTTLRLKISGKNESLTAQREVALTAALEKALLWVAGTIAHDHETAAIPARGEIVTFRMNKGGNP